MQRKSQLQLYIPAGNAKYFPSPWEAHNICFHPRLEPRNTSFHPADDPHPMQVSSHTAYIVLVVSIAVLFF